MPICSYLVSPVNERENELRERLTQFSECELERAENRDLYMLVTETEDMEHQKELEDRLNQVESIDWLMQTFGEICPEEGGDPIEQ